MELNLRKADLFDATCSMKHFYMLKKQRLPSCKTNSFPRLTAMASSAGMELTNSPTPPACPDTPTHVAASGGGRRCRSIHRYLYFSTY